MVPWRGRWLLFVVLFAAFVLSALTAASCNFMNFITVSDEAFKASNTDAVTGEITGVEDAGQIDASDFGDGDEEASVDEEIESGFRNILIVGSDSRENLPEGFDTRLGRNGDTLSVGQKQRLAIARGLVSLSPVLVLDEPTAALDPETENALVKALQAEREKRVLIVIAHRLSTVRHADCIHVLDAGVVVERGTHDELIARDGVYAQLWRVQTGEMVRELNRESGILRDP